MSDVAPSPVPQTPATPPRLRRILCGVHGGRPARHAVDQALALAGSGATVHFVAVCDVAGFGATEGGSVGVHRAEEALRVAREQARDAGIEATVELVHDDHPPKRLLALAADHDLLVIGSRGHSRAAEMALGGTAGLAAHRATVPVLIARRRAADAPFPGRVIAATDGRDGGLEVVRTAAALAGEAPLVLVHATDHEGAREHHELATEAAIAGELTGCDPVIVSEHRRPVELILDVADDQRAGLIVVGSGGRTGLRALGSVSERVCAQARCSVLVLRHTPSYAGQGDTP